MREDTSKIDLGAWIERTLTAHGLSVQVLSVESGLLYAYLSRLINSGKKGKPIRPDQNTVVQIGEGLVKLGAIPNKGEAEIAAGYIPAGYRVLPDDAGELRHDPDPDIQLIVEEASGNQDSRKALSSMAAALRASRAGAGGRRAE